MSQVPNLAEQGPDVMSGVTLEEFEERLRPFHGEIKGILIRGRALSGIGNAYSDEILFEAGIYPFGKSVIYRKMTGAVCLRPPPRWCVGQWRSCVRGWGRISTGRSGTF